MKRIFFLCVLSFSFLAMQAQDAPSVDEILNQYFENTGGKERWTSLNGMKMTGKMFGQGMEFPGILYMQRPNLQRIEIDIQGKQLIQAYDGETAWWINPFMGGEDPQPMPAEMAEEVTKEQFEDDFLNYADKGHTVEYVGTEEVEGAECHVLKLTKATGEVEFHLFDTEYMVPIMERTPIEEGPMKGQMAETSMSDYQEVDGLMLPHYIATKVNGQVVQAITIESIELDPEFDAALFAYPRAKEGEE
jgi:outer membrane lipoprotein-sorting protein